MFNVVSLYFLDIEPLKRAMPTVQTEADVPSGWGAACCLTVSAIPPFSLVSFSLKIHFIALIR